MTAPEPHAWSTARLWKATAAAIAVAVVILFTVVLPAEYGIDPTRIGRLIGLTDLQPQTAPAADAPVAAEEAEVPDELAAIIDGGIREAEPGVHESFAEAFRSERVSIQLASLEEVEFKARMKAGDIFLYSWKVERPLYVDMHGEPLNYPEEPAVRYEEKDGVASAHGRLTAPFAGLHGWYWLNTNDVPVTVTLEISGYYEALEEVYRSQQ